MRNEIHIVIKALGPHCQGQIIGSPRIQAIGDTLPHRKFGSHVPSELQLRDPFFFFLVSLR